MLMRLCFAILAGCTSLAAVDVHDRTITGTESYTDTNVNLWNVVVAAPTGNLTTIVNAGGRIAIQSSTAQTRVQQGGILHLVVPNQPPVVAWVGSSANPVTAVTLSAIANDDGGPGNLTYTWTKPSSVTWTSGNVGSSVSATFPQAGSYTFGVTVTDQGGLSASGSTTVSVSQMATTVQVSPNGTSTTETQTQFLATTRDQFGQLMPNPAFTWSMAQWPSNAPGSVSSTGLLTTNGLGQYGVKAAITEFPLIYGLGYITVTPNGHIVISPTSATVVVTETSQFTATLVDQFNAPLVPQPVFSYTVSPVSAGAVTAAGLFTAGAAAGGPYSVVASATGYAPATAAVTLVSPPMVYLNFSLYTPSLTTTPTNYALGSGWIKTVNGQDEMVPDVVNTNTARGNGQIVQWFAQGDAGLKAAYLTISNRPTIAYPVHTRLSYGHIVGPANQLRFQLDATDIPRVYYLTEVTYDSGTIQAQLGVPIYTQLKGYLPSIDRPYLASTFAYGYLILDNLGQGTYTASSGNARTSGLFPSYSFTVFPAANLQTYVTATVSATWSGSSTLANTYTYTINRSHLRTSNTTSGGQRFAISYDTGGAEILATATATNGTAVLGLLFGSFSSQQVTAN